MLFHWSQRPTEASSSFHFEFLLQANNEIARLQCYLVVASTTNDDLLVLRFSSPTSSIHPRALVLFSPSSIFFSKFFDSGIVTLSLFNHVNFLLLVCFVMFYCAFVGRYCAFQLRFWLQLSRFFRLPLYREKNRLGEALVVPSSFFFFFFDHCFFIGLNQWKFAMNYFIFIIVVKHVPPPYPLPNKKYQKEKDRKHLQFRTSKTTILNFNQIIIWATEDKTMVEFGKMLYITMIHEFPAIEYDIMFWGSY